mgnify:CR=1 FL=1
MQKELDHFMIGRSYGGNQEWFSNFMMRLGGCAAETACDSSVYFAREKGITQAYPYDAQHLTRKEYVEFSKIMEPYLQGAAASTAWTSSWTGMAGTSGTEASHR